MALLALLLAGAPFSSCTHGGQQGADDGDEASEQNGDGESDNAADDKDGDQAADDGLPHPTKPTPWQTRVLVRTTPQPTPERIYGCLEQVQHIAQDATNQQDMLNAQSQLTTLAAGDPTLYHFCFYQMMVRLDERLDQGGPMMTDLATIFFDGMRQLWLLARGLDGLHGRQRYFEYLQARYVQLSRDRFGRDVSIVGPPMGDVPANFSATTPAMGKPAGPAH